MENTPPKCKIDTTVTSMATVSKLVDFVLGYRTFRGRALFDALLSFSLPILGRQ